MTALFSEEFIVDTEEAAFSGKVPSTSLQIGDTGYMMIRYRVTGVNHKQVKGDSVVRSHAVNVLTASVVDADQAVGDTLLRSFEDAFNRLDEQVSGQGQIAPDDFPDTPKEGDDA